jgi:hypothetical protein
MAAALASRGGIGGGIGATMAWRGGGGQAK